MKPTKKEVKEAKKVAKKIEGKNSDKRIKDLEELIVLIDAKITSLENDMKSMQNIHNRIKKRLGL
jgi:hypothetical protein